MIASPTLMSASELLTYDAHGRRTELVQGKLIVREPVGGAHAGVLVGPNDALDGTPVLPGFVLPPASLWVDL